MVALQPLVSQRADFSHKYLGEDPPPEQDVVRLIVRVIPEKVTSFSV